MKKYLALALIAPLLVSCSSSNKKGAEYNEAWVKDTNGFDILMGQFAHNIENIWGYNEVLLAGPKDYVKYTDQYQTPATSTSMKGRSPSRPLPAPTLADVCARLSSKPC